MSRVLNNCHELTRMERRIIVVSASLGAEAGTWVVVPVEHYINVFRITRKTVLNGYSKLYGRSMDVAIDEFYPDKGLVVDSSRWLSAISYNEVEDTVGLIWATDVVDSLSDLVAYLEGSCAI